MPSRSSQKEQIKKAGLWRQYLDKRESMKLSGSNPAMAHDAAYRHCMSGATPAAAPVAAGGRAKKGRANMKSVGTGSDNPGGDNTGADYTGADGATAVQPVRWRPVGPVDERWAVPRSCFADKPAVSLDVSLTWAMNHLFDDRVDLLSAPNGMAVSLLALLCDYPEFLVSTIKAQMPSRKELAAESVSNVPELQDFIGRVREASRILPTFPTGEPNPRHAAPPSDAGREVTPVGA